MMVMNLIGDISDTSTNLCVPGDFIQYLWPGFHDSIRLVGVRVTLAAERAHDGEDEGKWKWPTVGLWSEVESCQGNVIEKSLKSQKCYVYFKATK